MSLIALVIGAFVGWIARSRRGCRSDRRLGRLPGAQAPAVLRAARLRTLGEAGTLRIYNCGEILHVDYEHGELVVAVVSSVEKGRR